MAILAAQKPTLAGTAKTLAAASAGGDSFQNSGIEMFHVKNAHATLARTVTFDSPNQCNFGLAAHAAHDAAIVVPALSERIIGPFPANRFNDVNDRVQVTYSDAAADLTVGVVSGS